MLTNNRKFLKAWGLLLGIFLTGCDLDSRSPTTLVTLSWLAQPSETASQPGTGYRVLLSRTSVHSDKHREVFSFDLPSQPGKPAPKSIQTKLPGGTWYWQVQTYRQGPDGDSQVFSRPGVEMSLDVPG